MHVDDPKLYESTGHLDVDLSGFPGFGIDNPELKTEVRKSRAEVIELI